MRWATLAILLVVAVLIYAAPKDPQGCPDCKPAFAAAFG